MNPLLLAAVTDADAAAHASWLAWRQSVDIQKVEWPDLQLIPVLNGPRFNEWLTQDSASGLLKGIVRRAWTEAQVRLALAQEAIAGLEEKGCGRVTLLGAGATHLRNRRLESIRPIPELRLLIPREHVAAAVAALRIQGWQAYGKTPGPDALDWTTHVTLSRNETQLYLHWRVLNVPARQALDCEHEFLGSQQTISAPGARFQVLADGHALLEVLAQSSSSSTADVVPWQVDAALIARDRIDWPAWTSLAAAYCPLAIRRISELRLLGVDVPVLPEPLETRSTVSRSRALRAWLRRALRVLTPGAGR